LLPAAAAAPGPVSVAMCVSSTAGDCNCAYTDTIQVKFCTGGGNNYYVYQLKNVPVCDMAYCAINGGGTHFSEVLTIFIRPPHRQTDRQTDRQNTINK